MVASAINCTYARPSGNPHIIFVIKSHFYYNPENPKLANPGLEKAKTSCFAEHLNKTRYDKICHVFWDWRVKLYKKVGDQHSYSVLRAWWRRRRWRWWGRRARGWTGRRSDSSSSPRSCPPTGSDDQISLRRNAQAGKSYVNSSLHDADNYINVFAVYTDAYPRSCHTGCSVRPAAVWRSCRWNSILAWLFDR